MKLHVWFIVIFKLLWVQELSAQNLQQSFELAEHLSSQMQYEAALDVYERVVFFDSTLKYRRACFYAIAEANKNLGNWEEAINYYNLSYYLTQDSEIQQEIQFQLISARLLNQDYISAQEELYVLEDVLTETDQDRFYFYQGITAFALGNYDTSEMYLSKYLGETNLDMQQELEKLFLENEKISRINPKTARILSIILPGLGQFYAGDIKNGLNSLFLSAGIMLIAINLGINGSIWDAILTATPWYVRYYQGGYKAAENIAKQKIAKKRSMLFTRLIAIMAQNVKDD